MRSFCLIRVDPNPKANVLIRRKGGGVRQRGEAHVKTKAEPVLRHHQTKEYPEVLEAKGKKRFSLEPSRKDCVPADNLNSDFWPQNYEIVNICCFGPSVFASLFSLFVLQQETMFFIEL